MLERAGGRRLWGAVVNARMVGVATPVAALAYEVLAEAAAVRSDLAEAQREVAHLVAEEFDADGCTWPVIAPLVEELVGGCWAGSPPVVLARALSATQRRQAGMAVRLLAAGDLEHARDLRDRVDHARARLREVLAL
jgi:hypothetical protein